MSSGFLLHSLLICQFELKRLFFTRKGLLYLITFSLVWYFILLYPVRYAADLLVQEHKAASDGSFLEFFGFDSLLNWKIPEMGVYWHFALLIFPLLAVMTSADQSCSDRERGTLRFLSLRVSRDSLFFGRFAGAMLNHALLIFISLLGAVLLALYRDAGLLTELLNSAMAIIVNLLIMLLPFTAMMAALSASVKSARQASVWAILIWSFLAGIISLLSSYLPALDSLNVLIPGYQMSALSQLAQWQALQLAYIPLLQSVVLLSIGRWIMYRKNL